MFGNLRRFRDLSNPNTRRSDPANFENTNLPNFHWRMQGFSRQIRKTASRIGFQACQIGNQTLRVCSGMASPHYNWDCPETKHVKQEGLCDFNYISACHAIAIASLHAKTQNMCQGKALAKHLLRNDLFWDCVNGDVFSAKLLLGCSHKCLATLKMVHLGV